VKDKKSVPIGLDLVDDKPDYTKSWEENWESYRQRYFDVYGEYPPELPGQNKAGLA